MTDDGADLMPVCIVAPADAGLWAHAVKIAETLCLPVAADWRQATARVALVVDFDRAWLQQLGSKPPGPLHVDFASPEMTHRRKGGQNELLGRAVGVKANKHPAVFDATAGLGRDAFVLADLGCEVTLVERSRTLAFLLEQAVDRARLSASDQVRHAVERMRVVWGESLEFEVSDSDVIYIDPMFPDRRNTAAVKKDLAVLQRLHGQQPDDSAALADWALEQSVSRVVVKRPAKAPPLTDRAPSHALSGKAVRFDVYVR